MCQLCVKNIETAISLQGIHRAIPVLLGVLLLTVIGSDSVVADETLLPQGTTTTIQLEQFDVESGLIWSQVDDQTIESSLLD